MAIKYWYANAYYDTESDAQGAVVSLKVRLDNNPTDWMVVKEIVGSQEAGWQMNPTTLTDEQINNLDNAKFYMAYSPVTGENLMPLTASEVAVKTTEFRAAYANWIEADKIIEYDDTATNDVENYQQPLATIITPNQDMTDYL